MVCADEFQRRRIEHELAARHQGAPQWLRKKVVRAAGLTEKHDEDALFAREVAELSAR